MTSLQVASPNSAVAPGPPRTPVPKPSFVPTQKDDALAAKLDARRAWETPSPRTPAPKPSFVPMQKDSGLEAKLAARRALVDSAPPVAAEPPAPPPAPPAQPAPPPAPPAQPAPPPAPKASEVGMPRESETVFMQAVPFDGRLPFLESPDPFMLFRMDAILGHEIAMQMHNEFVGPYDFHRMSLFEHFEPTTVEGEDGGNPALITAELAFTAELGLDSLMASQVTSVSLKRPLPVVTAPGPLPLKFDVRGTAVLSPEAACLFQTLLNPPTSFLGNFPVKVFARRVVERHLPGISSMRIGNAPVKIDAQALLPPVPVEMTGRIYIGIVAICAILAGRILMCVLLLPLLCFCMVIVACSLYSHTAYARAHPRYLVGVC
jgi:hypothetical protein